MPLKLIGAGLGRTGTASTKIALEKLGYGPCYHMAEVVAEPTRMAGWLDAASGKPDWEAIFEGYASTVDYPAASYWRQLSEYYPDARVLLNVRDPEKWFESVNDTILSDEIVETGRGTPHGEFLNATVYTIMDNRMSEREFMIEHFNHHVDEVKRTIDPSRLLVYEVRQGWKPLCDFLGVPVPDEPFPRVNSREETKQMLAMLRRARDWNNEEINRAVANKLLGG
ncbi:MAG: sulfotransferase family protein [Phycisphaerales bacterium JB043]